MREQLKGFVKILFENRNGDYCPSVKKLMKITNFTHTEIHSMKKTLYEMRLIANSNSKTFFDVDDLESCFDFIDAYFNDYRQFIKVINNDVEFYIEDGKTKIREAKKEITKVSKSINEIITINQENEKITVLGRDLYEFLEIETPYHIWFPRMLEYGFAESQDFSTYKNVQAISGASTRIDHQLTLDMAKEISMIQRNEKGKQARIYFIECEKKLKQIKVPKSYAEALFEAGRLALENERLAKERDNAIQTKAWISDKKTATAMVTASHLSRECNKLREEIGFCKKNATIKRMEILTKDKYRYKVLRDYCRAKELDITKVPDVNYGYVNAYPAEAWYNCYDIDLNDLF